MKTKIYCPDKGDIVYIDFDPALGHEQKKRRPALILSKKNYNQATGLCILVPITSTITEYPFVVRINDAQKVTGAILSDQIKSFAWKERRSEFIEKTSKNVLQEVCSKARTFFD